jgi:hypothetical protein
MDHRTNQKKREKCAEGQLDAVVEKRDSGAKTSLDLRGDKITKYALLQRHESRKWTKHEKEASVKDKSWQEEVQEW